MAPEADIPFWKQVTLYSGTVIGVLFSSAVLQFQAGKPFSLNFPIPTVILSIVIAFFIIPVVFEKLNVHPKAPFLAQYGLFVQDGVFWYLIFSSLSKAGAF